jgi:2'-5' RNA ligase
MQPHPSRHIRLDGVVPVSVCLLPDDPADRVVRRLWQRLEDSGVPTLLTHTHGRHLPHLTLASLTSCDLEAVHGALSSLSADEPVSTRVVGLGLFPRSRAWLVPVVTASLLARHARVVAAAQSTGADVHPHYLPERWLPHLTLSPRLTLDVLPVVTARVNEVLPLTMTFTRTALVQTATGEVVLTENAPG